ncbi:MAG: CCA tRNA nucleotidyltransferase [Clostridia bacterium]|jgi:tRNA nucleotidyltransferase (CCA-adding enzyme)|nr:CCA tRNA nucleotidyltransferase [Clostridia bacterium]MCI2015897.1 CCA tRNA nucleotidyltransferase [Clostridia bacterium]
MNIPKMPPDAAFIIKNLEKHGYEGYIVGGCVRDCIMGIEPHDWDITTSASPMEVKSIFPHTFDSGIKHGTVTVLMGNTNYEVTTYRVDGKYADCRHPVEVKFTENLHEDLLRRDFTMNAIAYNMKDGYVDIFGGIEDIKNKIIRGVGEPSERFREDALRMLRAIRFASQLGFDIEENTKKALEENVDLISKISSERIREEICKLLISPYTNNIHLLWDTGLLKNISQSIHESIIGHEDEIIKQISNSGKIISVLFSALIQFVPENRLKNTLALFKFDTKTLKEINLLYSNKNTDIFSDEISVRKTASKLGARGAELLYKFKAAQNNNEALKALNTLKIILEKKQCIDIKSLSINGSDLKNIGISPGKKMGEILNYLLQLVLENPSLNSRDALLNEAEKYLRK